VVGPTLARHRSMLTASPAGTAVAVVVLCAFASASAIVAKVSSPKSRASSQCGVGVVSRSQERV